MLKYLTRLCFRLCVLIDLRCNFRFVGFGSSIRSVLDGGDVMLAPRNGDCWFVVYAQKSFSLWSGCFFCFRSIYGRWCLMLSSFIIVSFWLLFFFFKKREFLALGYAFVFGDKFIRQFQDSGSGSTSTQLVWFFWTFTHPFFFFFAIRFCSHTRICWVVDGVCICYIFGYVITH